MCQGAKKLIILVNNSLHKRNTIPLSSRVPLNGLTNVLIKILPFGFLDTDKVHIDHVKFSYKISVCITKSASHSFSWVSDAVEVPYKAPALNLGLILH